MCSLSGIIVGLAMGGARVCGSRSFCLRERVCVCEVRLTLLIPFE